MEKHYDSEYLKKAAVTVSGIKNNSYQFFQDITEGIIVDLGCGNGFDIVEMQKNLSPTNTYIGVDHDSNLLKNNTSQYESKNLHFIQAEASKLPFDNNSISGIRSERMFQHLENPVETMSEIYRVLETDSPLIILETDWHGINMYSDNLAIELQLSKYLVEKKVKFGIASRKIPDLLTQTNFSIKETIVSPVLIKSLQEANDVLKIEQIFSEMVELNYISSKESKAFIDKLIQKDTIGNFNCAVDLITFCAYKN